MAMTSADAIAARLAREGCRHAFGMPGGEVLSLMQALSAAGIEFTLCKHENNAGFMAEGSWQATGAPGILLATIGPGIANAVNSIANAFQEQVPLIVLSGCIDRAEGEGFTHQVFDQSALLAPITKATFRVAEGTAAAVIEKAVSIAVADPPGPVHVDLPHNLADTPVVPAPISATPRSTGVWPEGAELEAARNLLAKAERPIVVAGLGAVLHDAGQAIQEFCESRGAPLLTTYKAKGVIPEDHPLCLGGHGLSPLSDKSVLPLLAASDCVVLAGYDPIEMRSGWCHPWKAENAIEICHAATEHGMHGSAVRFVGNVPASLNLLGQAQKASVVWPGGEPATVRSVLADAFAPRDDWGPHQVFDCLREVLPEEGVLTIDSGAHRILASQMWKSPAPRRVLQSTCLCTMGVAVPLAAGYKKASPDTVVAAVVGDAGLEMGVGDLSTLRDQGLNIIIVVTVDASLSLIQKKQRASQLPNLGVEFGETDIVAVAKAFGGNGIWIEDRETLKAALNSAMQDSKFSILACRIDKAHYWNAF
ncbi:MAG: thiamine pyrophosphate-binding protein [Alphaproteobacteria bacterium]